MFLALAFSLQEDQSSTDKSDDLVRVLRELTVVQRNIANLQVELQGRKVIDRYPAVGHYAITAIPHHAKTLIKFSFTVTAWH